MQGNRSRHDVEVQPASLATLVAVALISLIASALITSVVLVASDRFDRPSLVVIDAVLPTIVVQIDGAVATPGSYRLPGGARLDELVDRAGGLAVDADIGSLNLAARVGDGEHVRIPVRATVAPARVSGTPTLQPAPININTASATDLAELPGIGPVLSERIVAYREANGPFTSLDQIADVDGISAGLLEELRPMITIDD